MASTAAREVLFSLDVDQQAAVLAPLGPVRIVAGAGTGKTRTITHRIAYQALTGVVQPSTVLAVTHSARAAGEMRDRMVRLGVHGVQTRTFHSAALRQLRYFWGASGLPGSTPEVVAGGERFLLLRRALAASLDVPAGKVLSTDVTDLDSEVTWAKARRVPSDGYAAAAAGRSRTLAADTVAAAYSWYENAKRSAAQLDFDDLLAEMSRVLETEPLVAERLRAQYLSFIVDEYQDTDPAQQRLLDAWLGERDPVCVVGDPYQTIYSFKGAEPSLLADFGYRFPAAVTVTLVRDYRSTPQVVAAANLLMADVHGTGPVLEGQQPPGPQIALNTQTTEVEEEKAVAARALSLIRSGTPADEIAILHRFNSQAVALQAALQTLGLPVVLGDNERFFDRPEIKRVLQSLASNADIDPDASALETLDAALETAGFDSENPPAGAGAARERWEAQGALATTCRDFPPEFLTSAASLSGELHKRAAEEHAPRQGGAVTVSTIHKAKGLEWDAVLITRVTDGSIPSVYATTPAQIAEERRLLYVAITRARRVVEVSRALERGAGTRKLVASPFLSPVFPPPAQVFKKRAASTGTAATIKKGPVGLPRGAPKPTGPSRFAPGDRITHDAHGLGRVLAVNGNRITVDFGSRGKKVIAESSRKLTKI